MKSYLISALLVSAGSGLVAFGSAMTAYHRHSAVGLALVLAGLAVWTVEYIHMSHDKKYAIKLVSMMVCFLAATVLGFCGLFVFGDLLWLLPALIVGMVGYMIGESLEADARENERELRVG